MSAKHYSEDNLSGDPYLITRELLQELCNDERFLLDSSQLPEWIYAVHEPEKDYHRALRHAVQTLEELISSPAREAYPPGLRQILQKLQHHMGLFGPCETLAVKLLYGTDLRIIHSHLADISAQEYLGKAREGLKTLLTVPVSKSASAEELYGHYQRYHSHVGELIAVYDDKIRAYNSKTGLVHFGTLGECHRAQENLLEDFWFTSAAVLP